MNNYDIFSLNSKVGASSKLFTGGAYRLRKLTKTGIKQNNEV